MPGVEKFVSSQPQYSMIWRGIERDVIPSASGERHLADRLVAARAGRAHRQVQAGRAAARGQPRGARSRWAVHGPRYDDDAARARAAAAADRGRARHHDGAARARLGAARAERRLRDHRRVAAGAGRGQRGAVGHRARRGRRCSGSTRSSATASSYEGAAS